MRTLRIHDVVTDRILVSRESARCLEAPLRAMLPPPGAAGETPDTEAVTIDFEGVEGMAPSFLDELLVILESFVATANNTGNVRLIVVNPPTRLSRKFAAVARGHGMSVRAQPDGSWLLTGASDASA